MRIKLLSTCYLFIILTLFSPSLHAIKPRAKYFKSQEDADCYLTMRYNLGCKYYNAKDWRKASSEFEKVIFYFPSSDAAAEASYYLAVCYFEMKEYDFANEEFSNYLKASQHPAFFEDAVAFKFCIAEHFKLGKKRRPFKMRYLPKWISGQDSALVIYDEVVAALPHHELAFCALYSKGELLKKMREYRDSVEAYQTIIRRFPKNEIVPVCYLNIADAYVQQARLEFQNPDILALAELNVRKFQNDFPRDERVAIAEESVCLIKEMYAKGLCDLGLFYERIHQPNAAAIYFQSSIEEFPDTNVAQFCRSRLICLGFLQEEACADADDGESAAPAIEQLVPPCEGEAVSSVDDQPNQAWESMPVQQPQVANYQPSNCQVPVYYEKVPPQQRQGEEYIHYSLTKKREAHYPCEEGQLSSCQQGPSTWVDENSNPSGETQNNGAPYEAWHYSAIKHRDQYAPCQD